MHFEEMGNENGKTLMLLPGTCCNYETNFKRVLGELGEKYHLICINYDGFDGSNTIFSSIIDVNEKIEQYIIDYHNGHIDAALGSSLGSSFVGQLIQRKRIHMDHGIFGSPDLDQCGEFGAKLQTRIMYPIISGASKKNGKAGIMRKLMINGFHMGEEVADDFMECFAKFKPESIFNEYYTDLITCLDEKINADNTQVHFIYAKKMGEKYRKRYQKYFANPDIREFDMQHEQWLFGDDKFKEPVLRVIDEFMNTTV